MNGLIDETFHTVIKAGGMKERKKVPLIKEHNLAISVNGEQEFSLTCINDLLYEFVVGRLLTTGYILGIEDIKLISFDQSFENANAILRCDSKGKIPKHKMKNAAPIEWNREDIFELANDFSEGMPIHSVTQSTHSCLLAKGSTVLFSCEDIGRHNTVDKAVGYAVLNNINLAECTLYISGRIPVDMMQKVIFARIPVVVSKSVPTIDSVKLAKKYGVTLIAKAYPDQIEIFD